MTIFGVALFGCASLGMMGAVVGRRSAGDADSGWTMLAGVGVGVAVYLLAATVCHAASRKRGLAKWKEETLAGLSLFLMWGSPAIAFFVCRMIGKII